MQTPFDNPFMPPPSPSGDFQGTRGGFDLPQGMKETPGVIPNQPTIDSFTGDSAPKQEDISDFIANRTWPASRAQNS